SRISPVAATAAASLRKSAGPQTGHVCLNAAWSTLDKQQRSAALSVQTLGAQYSKLATAMEPQVFQVFNAGLTLADSLLGPVSELASKAADGVESLVTQFRQDSGIQQFIRFLAGEAGPALHLLGTDIAAIAKAVFSLLESFGGLGLAELKAFTAVLTSAADVLAWLAQHAPGITAAAVAVGGLAPALSKFRLLSAVVQLTCIPPATETPFRVTAPAQSPTGPGKALPS